MHRGEPYHRLMTASQRDLRIRSIFLRSVLDLLAPCRRILDFGAGTGIDAKMYAAAGHTAWV